MLQVINYKDNKDIAADFAPLCKEAFPWNEIPPVTVLIKKASQENISLLCFYDNDDFVGLAYLIENEKYAYLFLLAVSPEKRSQHYGEKILNHLKDIYKDSQIVLSYEEVAPKYKNFEQRKKRQAFYDRNGFLPVRLKTKEFFINFQVASNDKNCRISFKEYAKLLYPIFGKIWVKLMFKERKY